jgi:hypothetical protein
MNMGSLRALLSLGASAWIGVASISAANAGGVIAPPAACDVRAWNVYDMPGDKTYAIVLRSATGSTSDVRLHLYSDLNDYDVVLPGVTFEIAPIDPDPSAPPQRPDVVQYESAALFFELPRPDPLLLVDARETGASAGAALCRIRHYHTDAWGKMFSPPIHTEKYLAQEKDLTQKSKSGVAAAAAVLTSTTAKTCSTRYERSRGSDVDFDGLPALLPRHATEIAKVLVDLSADGSIVGETLYQSTGNTALDDATLDIVSKRSYKPEIFRCEGLGGSSMFQMKFHSK